jgi:hypothetical protein
VLIERNQQITRIDCAGIDAEPGKTGRSKAEYVRALDGVISIDGIAAEMGGNSTDRQIDRQRCVKRSVIEIK